MIRFRGRTISGSHGPLVVGSPEQHVRRQKYWDLKGEAEIRGEAGGRVVTVDILIHDTYTQSELLAELSNLDGMVGKHGTLEETGNVERRLKACTFDGYELIPMPGQENTSMLQDVAGTLRDEDGERETHADGTGGWFQHIRMMFRQLVVE